MFSETFVIWGSLSKISILLSLCISLFINQGRTLACYVQFPNVGEVANLYFSRIFVFIELFLTIIIYL